MARRQSLEPDVLADRGTPDQVDRVLRPDDVAVVGMALRVPGANSPEQFWSNVAHGVDCLTRTPSDALAAAGVPEKLRADPRYVPSKPKLHDIEFFDADFFDMTPPEVDRTDPGHRLFLECAWEALERAGIAPGRTPAIGVFAGSGTSPGGSYFVKNIVPRREDLNDPIFAIPARVGNFSDFLSSRVSFALDLVGPSFGVQAACATSLLAVHLAKESIRRGECTIALAGGCSAESLQTPGYLSGIEGMLSASGVVRTFDADADGTVFGSGVAVVALERLEDALAAGHRVHAVILGSGCSNDGSPPTKASFVAPSPEGQTLAITQAMDDAGVNPQTIGYVEAHGTATRLGDPTEVVSLTNVFRRHTQDKQFCALGSVKPNVGHLRQAAGVVGLIKACLALKHGVLPPSINFESPNPRIDFDTSPFYVPTNRRSWERSGHPRRAGVSAFGFGGTNAHVLLEEPPRPPESGPSRGRQLLVVSAQTERALDRSLSDLGSHLEQRPELSVLDVAHTLRVGRKAFRHRAATVVEEATFSASSLRDRGRLIRGEASGESRPCVFMFPGQGSQQPGMGQRLYATEEVYREAIDRCADLLQPSLGADIRSVLYPEPEHDEARALEALRQTTNAQSALFVVEYAMAQLFLSWGVEPQAMLGHSIGEYVAACLAGVFSLPMRSNWSRLGANSCRPVNRGRCWPWPWPRTRWDPGCLRGSSSPRSTHLHSR